MAGASSAGPAGFSRAGGSEARLIYSYILAPMAIDLIISIHSSQSLRPFRMINGAIFVALADLADYSIY